MIFSFPLAMQPHLLGHAYEDSDVTVFFGNKNSSAESLAKAFPDYKLLLLNQTHSDEIVAAPYFDGATPKADAHYSKHRRLALCIRTADCIPILIFDPSSGQVAAIHAGWRGVENEILRKTAERLTLEGAHLERARAWIGPHIRAESFEVGIDIGRKLEARLDAVRGFTSENSALRAHEASGKVRVDLLTIIKAQLSACGIGAERLHELAINTFVSSDHESFRRDGDKAGRQLSFIALK